MAGGSLIVLAVIVSLWAALGVSAKARSIFLLLAIIPTTASAADWKKVASSDTGTVNYVDAGSIRRDGIFVTAWLLEDLAHDRTSSARQKKFMMIFNCRDRQMASKSWVEYAPSGEVVSNGTNSRLTWKPAVPDTVGEAEINFVCDVGSTGS